MELCCPVVIAVAPLWRLQDFGRGRGGWRDEQRGETNSKLSKTGELSE